MGTALIPKKACPCLVTLMLSALISVGVDAQIRGPGEKVIVAIGEVVDLSLLEEVHRELGLK